jgi:hypothetical protein
MPVSGASVAVTTASLVAPISDLASLDNRARESLFVEASK